MTKAEEVLRALWEPTRGDRVLVMTARGEREGVYLRRSKNTGLIVVIDGATDVEFAMHLHDVRPWE